MRCLAILFLLAFLNRANAQIGVPGALVPYRYGTGYVPQTYLADSNATAKKWFVSRYSAIRTSYSVFKGGSATVFAAPMGLQLNRRLTNNLYAFANATIAPTYINFNRSLVKTDVTKGFTGNGLQRASQFNLYSSASVGLQYVNDEKTFSISGSISVERGAYPLLPYYGSYSPLPASVNNQRAR